MVNKYATDYTLFEPTKQPAARNLGRRRVSILVDDRHQDSALKAFPFIPPNVTWKFSAYRFAMR